jgi:RimJ/RimL family protein N-acetyltransferase
MTITIRPLEPSDWKIVKNMRLRALQAHPGVFSGIYDVEKLSSDQKWKETLSGGDKCVFGLFEDKILIGITGLFTWREDPSGQSGVMAYSYIEPAYRGQRLTQLMYKARIDWAIHHKYFKRLVIAHREGNEPSRRAMIAHGFQFIDKIRKKWPDGIEDWEYNYELDLEKLRS